MISPRFAPTRQQQHSATWAGSSLFLLLMWILRLGVLPAEAQSIPLGEQFLVNTDTLGAQESPAIAVDTSGSFVAIWQNAGYGMLDSLRGQRFGSNGMTLGNSFAVNSNSLGRPTYPAVAMDGSANFVVAWQSTGADNGDDSYTSIQARRFASDGTPLGDDFLVNTYTTSYQDRPALAMHSSGSFIVVWDSRGSDNGDDSYASVQGQQFDNEGLPIDNQFLVNSYITFSQWVPSVAISGSGDFIVAWQGVGPGDDETGTSVHGRRFSSNGSPLDTQFLVHSEEPVYQSNPSVAANASGEFIVVWGRFDGSYTANAIRGQRFDATGSQVGSYFQVSPATLFYSQQSPQVAMDPAGNFVVVWHGRSYLNGDDNSINIQGQRFRFDGVSLGANFLVNSFTPQSQRHPAIGSDDLGNFVVVWESDMSDNGDPNSLSIQGQRFCSPECGIFADGFETGTTTAWSSRSGELPSQKRANLRPSDVPTNPLTPLRVP